jgi:hypothetical protein
MEISISIGRPEALGLEYSLNFVCRAGIKSAPSDTSPPELFPLPLEQVLGFGGFRWIHVHSCRSGRYHLILLGLRVGKL